MTARSIPNDILPFVQTDADQVPKIQKIFSLAGDQILNDERLALSYEQRRTIRNIQICRTQDCGFNLEVCQTCGSHNLHYSSCADRNCPLCQGVKKERWIDLRCSEVLDCAYYHATFTCPHELEPLFLANQKLLYSLFHKCVGKTIVELTRAPEHLGVTPGVIQVFHSWTQELLFHPHIHAIISGGGLTKNRELKILDAGSFFIAGNIMAEKFSGTFISELDKAWQAKSLFLGGDAETLRNSYEWAEFRDSLYHKKWVVNVKETFNGKGNALEYLGRYTYKIAISESRILSVSETAVLFTARGEDGKQSRIITVTPEEFIRRFLLHVLPQGFQKIRYYGYLNNCSRKNNLILLFNLQGYRQHIQKYKDMKTAELIFEVWGHDVAACPHCQAHTLISLCHIRGKPNAAIK